MAPVAARSVCGLGDPVMDVIVDVSHEFLSSLSLAPGGCLPVDAQEMERLLAAAAMQGALCRVPGGSTANVMKGLANVTRGSLACKFAGMVGKDGTGREYRDKLAAHGVAPVLLESGTGAPSASCLCLVTPDGQRTMRTCLGASLELSAAEQLPPMWHEGLQLLHCEGYCLYRPQLAAQMTAAARQHGAVVSMDLASFELVGNCKASFVECLRSGCLDLVFANQQEAEALAEVMGLAPAEAPHETKVKAAQDFLLEHVKVSVVSLGAKGCIARSSTGKQGGSLAPKVAVVDTCGAGDTFTAGFLAAFLQGADLESCSAAGCAAGSEAVQVKGAEISAEGWERLRQTIARICSGGAASS